MRGLALWLRPRLGIGPQIAAVVLVIGLAGAMAIEPTRRLLEQRDRIAGLQADLESLNEGNRALADRIRRLRDPDYLEQQARELGLVRPSERAFVVLPPSERAARRRERRAHDRRRLEAPSGFWERALHFVGLG
jgi:cell division protein FtsB